MKRATSSPHLTSVEICAGAGGQALGLEAAGFHHLAVVEIDPHACNTLEANRPEWNVQKADLHEWDPSPYRGAVDLFAGGVPCPPFSMAGKQLGADDERDLFPRALEMIEEIQPRAVMLENVRGLMGEKFASYRMQIINRLDALGYRSDWRLINASDYGVPQFRPRFILVAIGKDEAEFHWPEPHPESAPTVGEALLPYMKANGWEGAEAWAEGANAIAPTLVGGSKKHGGPDLGPTRAKRAWAVLGVNAHTIAPAAPEAGFTGMPRLTVAMAAAIQGFPADYSIAGAKTNAYRQVGNAFPPPVAEAVGRRIAAALSQKARTANKASQPKQRKNVHSPVTSSEPLFA